MQPSAARLRLDGAARRLGDVSGGGANLSIDVLGGEADYVVSPERPGGTLVIKALTWS